MVTLQGPKDSNSNYRLVVSFDIKQGWHLYANETNSGGQVVTVDWKQPDGVKAIGDWKKPQGEFYAKDPQARIYTNQFDFTCEIAIDSLAKAGEIEVQISYQVCNQNLCLPPEEITKTVEVIK